MRLTSMALIGSLAAGPVASPASAAPPSRPHGPHPEAPPETAQFAFLVGEWDCSIRQMKPDGSGWNEGHARWTGYWILGGWAIQDDWESPSLDGGTFRGTNIRSFNPRSGRWDNRWLPAGTLRWARYEAEKVGETMVMIGGEGRDRAGRDYLDRNTFSDLSTDSWKWRKDRSFDGGQTWVEGVAFVEARRSGSAR